MNRFTPCYSSEAHNFYSEDKPSALLRRRRWLRIHKPFLHQSFRWQPSGCEKPPQHHLHRPKTAGGAPPPPSRQGYGWKQSSWVPSNPPPSNCNLNRMCWNWSFSVDLRTGDSGPRRQRRCRTCFRHISSSSARRNPGLGPRFWRALSWTWWICSLCEPLGCSFCDASLWSTPIRGFAFFIGVDS